MARFSIGCQTYTWEMLGAAWQGPPEAILDALAQAGYAGVEFSNNMIGAFLDQPEQFEAALERRGLHCAGFAYARQGFSDPQQFETDLAGAKAALSFAAHFSAPLCLGGPSSPSRQAYDEKLFQALRFYAEVARRARDLGVRLAVHPHSHHTSLVVTAAEYARLLEAVEPLGLFFNPDTGHILRGGQDLMSCLRRYQDRIIHVHVKDVDEKGAWAPLGQGVTPLRSLFDWLEEVGYAGWVVIEEESEGARQDPAEAVAANRRYLASILSSLPGVFALKD
jgi:sugar phosphate isomerase/epimerase